MLPQEIVKKVLDLNLLPNFPYNLNVVEVGDTWYVNVEIIVDTSKYHRTSPNHELEYFNKFYHNIKLTLDKALDLLGGVAYLNSFVYKKIHLDWLDELEKKIDINVKNFSFTNLKFRALQPEVLRLAKWKDDESIPAITILIEKRNNKVSKVEYNDLTNYLIEELNLEDFRFSIYENDSKFTWNL
jgi:hypothetical protein